VNKLNQGDIISNISGGQRTAEIGGNILCRILIVDDDDKLRDAIGRYARFQGYDVAEASNGLQAVELCRVHSYGLIILDVSMPEMDGITACREIRKSCDTPVIMLTARDEEYDRILGFESGADDYVAKPFSPKELMLRIAAVLKRSGKSESGDEAQYLKSGGIEMNLKGRTLCVDGNRVDLTTKEFDLLACLMRKPGVALLRSDLLDRVWNRENLEGINRSLDTHIKRVRKALGAYSGQIVTLRGVGYRFDEY